MRSRTWQDSRCAGLSHGLPLLLWLLLAIFAVKIAGVGGHERRLRDLPSHGGRASLGLRAAVGESPRRVGDRPRREPDGEAPRGGLTSGPSRIRLFGRGRRQAVRAYVGMESSTPANLERAPGSSQYPWAIVWGPTAVEEGSTDPTAVDPGAPHPGGSRSRHGLGTAQAEDHATPDQVILGETPATLGPFLFGRTTQGTDPQLYVTVTVSTLIVVAAISIILKFCWDRNWQRRRESTRDRGVLTEESRQALTGQTGGKRGTSSIFGPYRDPRAQSPDSEPTSPTELEENLEYAGKGVRFHRNRIPLVTL